MTEKQVLTPQPDVETSAIPWAEFLAEAPPGKRCIVDGITQHRQAGGWTLASPAIGLFCSNSACDKETFYDCENNPEVAGYDRRFWKFLAYRCRHCQSSLKVFAVLVKLERN